VTLRGVKQGTVGEEMKKSGVKKQLIAASHLSFLAEVVVVVVVEQCPKLLWKKYPDV
jgi:hypothetical protein